ncbi:MAG: hypothetical protein AAF493_00235 [Pseudomonadota bacterium]
MLDDFLTHYARSGSEFNVLLARLFVCFFLVWKILSRDFGFFASFPYEITAYPVDIYSTESYVFWTGTWLITDLLTFHWIHWFLPPPSASLLTGVQYGLVSLIAIWAIFGDIHGKWLSGAIYAALIYLWGYIFRSGQEIDSIALYFGMLICLILNRGKNRPITDLPSTYRGSPTRFAGYVESNMLLVLCTYYFASGLRKLTDLLPWEWFQYDLALAVERQRIISQYASGYAPEIFDYLLPLGGFAAVFAAVVYVSHLVIPFVFFRRELLFHFFLFYAVFHFLTFGVGISFTGYIVVWGCVLPLHRIISRAERRSEA